MRRAAIALALSLQILLAIADCGVCENGQCVGDLCQCDARWIGAECRTPAYTECFDTNRLCLTWSVDETNVSARLDWNTTGWAGVIFGSQLGGGMANGNVWVAWWDGATNRPHVENRFSERAEEPDESNDVFHDIVGWSEGGRSHVQFRRARDTGKPRDQPMIGGVMPMGWAVGFPTNIGPDLVFHEHWKMEPRGIEWIAAPPSLPGDITAVVRLTSLGLRWTPSTSSRPITYVLYIQGGAYPEFQEVFRGPAPEFLVEGLEGFVTYHFRLRAFNEIGGTDNVTASFMTNDLPAPDMPERPSLNPSDLPTASTISMQWPEPNLRGQPLTNYHLFRQAERRTPMQSVIASVADTLDDPSHIDGTWGPLYVRLAWHAGGTYDPARPNGEPIGGSNGATMRFEPEYSDGGNAGISPAIDRLDEVKRRHSWISIADIWTLAGSLAIEDLGGPNITWQRGRVDFPSNTDQVPPNGRLPAADLGSEHIRDVFPRRMKFTDEHTVVLCVGGHAIGRGHAKNSGYVGPWTTVPHEWFLTQYVPLLFQKDQYVWREYELPRQSQWEHRDLQSGGLPLFMLPTDFALLDDPAFKDILTRYRTNLTGFEADFAVAWKRLMEIGVPDGLLQPTPETTGGILKALREGALTHGEPEWELIYTGQARSFTDRGLNAAHQYNYRVQVETPGGRNESRVVTHITAAPSCPGEPMCNGRGTCGAAGCQCGEGFSGFACEHTLSKEFCATGNQRWCGNFFFEPAGLNNQGWVFFHFHVTGNPAWVGFMFGATQGMTNGDLWLVHFNEATNQNQGLDYWSTGQTTPTLDPPASQDVVLVSASRDATGVRAIVRRRLDTGDTAMDRVISRDPEDVTLSWAYGAGFFHPHTAAGRGVGIINFASGSFASAPAGDYWRQYAFVALVIAGTGVITFVIRQMGNSKLPNLCLQTRLGMPATHLLACVPDLLIGELVVVLFYIGTLTGFILESVRLHEQVDRDWRFVSGHVAAFHMAITLLPIVRNSIWLSLFGIPFERGVKWHRWIGRLAIIAVIVHFALMIDLRGDWSILFDRNPTAFGDGILWGTLTLICLLVLGLLTFEPIRRRYFELFFFPHHLYVPSVVFAALHSRHFLYAAIIPIGLYIVDRLVRFYRSQCRPVSVDNAGVLASEDKAKVTKLTLHIEHFSYEAGDYCFLNVPQISGLQWHPFSISSTPGEKDVTFHILANGGDSWTEQLANLCGGGTGKVGTAASLNSDGYAPLLNGGESWDRRIKVDGPYGKLGLDLDKYEVVVMVAGGIGVTPMASILGRLLHYPKSRKLTFVWGAREQTCFQQWFPTLLNKAQDEGVRLRLYNSGRGGSGIEGGEKINVRQGRPNYHELLDEVAKNDSHAMELPDSVAVLACGPAPMVAAVQRAAQEFGFHFHKETFAL